MPKKAMPAAGRRKGVDVATLPSTARRCVSLSFLLRLTDHYGLWDKTTRDVVAEVIVPLTKEKACCWSELDPETSLLREGELGPPQVFVSHAWSNSWALLVQSLESFATANGAGRAKLMCWIDIFVINQHNYMSELSQLSDVIGVCANFIQCVDTDTALPLGRVWCLYEVFSRLQSKKGRGGLFIVVASVEQAAAGLDKGAAPGEGGESGGIGGRARPGLMAASKREMEQLLANVDMEKAEATYPEDVEKIFAMVRTLPGGFAAVNAQVQEALVHCAVRNTLEEIANGRGGAGTSGDSGGTKKKKTGKATSMIEDLYAGLEL
eukprot:jgi/Tetstr1/424909/TSEL_015403.t1